jgi:2-dehydropantoate 2-reductase
LTDQQTGRIAVAGAGNIGCFVGGMLASAGYPVTLLARRGMIDDIRANGLHLTSYEGLDRHVPADALTLADDPASLAQAAIILVTVKSPDTAAMATLIANHAPANAVIVSLQNGVGNTEVLRAYGGDRRVLAGMVPFNVVSAGAAHVHRATSGDIVLEQDEAGIAAQLSVPGLAMSSSGRIADVQWGKLLFNLNNAINALSGLPLREQLAQRPWRVLLAHQIVEALRVMKTAGIKPVLATPLPAPWLPFVLRLPDPIFRAIAGSMLKIDPQARSSMWDDLQRGRRTEIDDLQGAIVGLGKRYHQNVTLSERLLDLMRTAETEGRGSPRMKPDQIVRIDGW